MKKILFVFRHAPYASALAREGLEALLAAAVYEQDVAVLFINDGIYQLVDQQSPEPGIKNHSRMLSALPMYGVDAIYFHAPSLDQRGISSEMLALQGQSLSDADTHSLMAACDQLLSF